MDMRRDLRPGHISAGRIGTPLQASGVKPLPRMMGLQKSYSVFNARCNSAGAGGRGLSPGEPAAA